MQKIHSFVAGSDLIEEGAEVVLDSPVSSVQGLRMADATDAAVDRACELAQKAFVAHAFVPAVERIQWLRASASLLEQRVDDFAKCIVEDIGKPVRVARIEVRRGVEFIRACAVQLQTLGGEMLPLDTVQAGVGHYGFTRRVPYGVVAAITPFNAPVNLLLQKIAPALAAGNAVVVKPHPTGVRAAIAMARLFIEAGVPAGLINVLTGDRAPAQALARHPLVRVVTFTGGTRAGDALASAAGARKFIAELGSSAANVVLRDADLADAARKIAAAGFEASGQQCVSAQRVIVEAPVYEAFLTLLVDAARALRTGDPFDEATDVGTMVSRAAADRVMAMARDAVAAGGRFALEPVQTGSTVSPGILVDAPAACAIRTEEAFGPLLVVMPAESVEHALELANDSPFGLQGALFTRDIGSAFRFAERFDVGSMWVNEASRFRLDIYPFGGSKHSGHGREGVRYALEELSQTRFIGIRPL